MRPRSTNTCRTRRSRCLIRARPVRSESVTTGLTWRAGSSTTSAKPQRSHRRAAVHVSDVLTAPVHIGGPTGREPGCLHERHRLRLGGEADRRVSGRGRRRSRSMGGYQLTLSAWTFSAAVTATASRHPSASSLPASRCATASRCPTRTTCSCPATASWCRCSRAGSRCTTATRRPSSRTFSWPGRVTTARPRKEYSTRETRRVSSRCR